MQQITSGRAGWIAFGLAVHGLFAFTVWHLFWFLKGGGPASPGGGLALDAALAAGFGVLHSLILWPRVRERLLRFVPAPAYGCFFCLVTCATLLATIFAWHRSPHALWRLEGWPRLALQAAFYASWALLVYSLRLTGFGYQTGWTPWYQWVAGRPLPRRRFEPRGIYRWLRHPVYLSFLGLVWFTPDMTLDRVVLVVSWTIYVFVGSHLKDRRLLHYNGEAYRRYQARVPGYPGVWFGPLGRVPLPAS